MDLFTQHSVTKPLAERMRPQTLEDYIGQEHLLGEGKPLRMLIEAGKIPSMIFWGPPGVGKTTLALILSNASKRKFVVISAIQSGLKEVREVIEQGRNHPGMVLFIDEIHRFNKTQQDSLLAAVEKGIITLIGATTENPSFEVIPALLSRCQVYVLQQMQEAQIRTVLERALLHDEWLRSKSLTLEETEAFYQLSGGDARKALNLLELIASTLQHSALTNTVVMQVAQQKIQLYDKSGEQHYDIISAFIKSMRGSDPQGAVYWLARMLDAGEDIVYCQKNGDFSL